MNSLRNSALFSKSALTGGGGGSKDGPDGPEGPSSSSSSSLGLLLTLDSSLLVPDCPKSMKYNRRSFY